MPPTRRDVLRRSGVALAAVGGAGAVGRAAGQTADEYAAPTGVTISYDQSRLERYRPWLDLSALKVKPYALFGLIAESPNYEYDVMVYAARYTHQDGVSSLSPPLTDSHLRDTEWLYVYVSESGSVEEVVYTAYHWTAKQSIAPNIPLYDGTHPVAHVVRPWHHYVLNGAVTGEFVDIDNLNAEDAFDRWLTEQGMADNLAPGTVRDPDTMRRRESWWRSGFDAWYAELFHSVLEPLPVIG